jgi:GTPase
MSGHAEQILPDSLRALARLATQIENRDPEALRVLRKLPSKNGLILGVTGPPGAGKSTLVDRLARAYRAQGKTVAILAVDPSSAVTGGAILGDRIRMQAHHADPGIFIRSMATRGAHGGLAHATADLARFFQSAGRDVVIIETVGVGQAEVDIARLAAVTLVVLVPGMGDDVQAMKAGILEVADLFVINKADHPGADQIEREIHMVSDRPIVRTVATEGTGIPELMAAIEGAPRHSTPTVPVTGGVSIDHLGIAVRSIDEILPFYRDQLGLELSLRETVKSEQVNVAMLPVDGPRIELLEAFSPDSVVGRFIAKRGPGIHHIALRVRDLPGTVDKLRAAGARLLNEPRKGAGGHEYVFVHPESTGGVLLELIQEREETV